MTMTDARPPVRIVLEGIGTLGDEASAFIYAEARRTHRPIHEVCNRIIQKALEQLRAERGLPDTQSGEHE
jgi:hypothetical protein